MTGDATVEEVERDRAAVLEAEAAVEAFRQPDGDFPGPEHALWAAYVSAAGHEYDARTTYESSAGQVFPALIARVRELEAALRPFADAVSGHEPDPGRELWDWLRAWRPRSLTVADCRRAAEVLGRPPEEPDNG